MLYFDHNATTPVLPEVWEAMRPYAGADYGNPSSIHAAGRRARLALDMAREKIAALLAADPSEIIFTSGATEANNLAIKGAALHHGKGSIVTTAVEHPSVLQPAQALEMQGFALTVLGVDREGHVAVEDVTRALTPETILFSLQVANNETGTLQDTQTLGRIAKDKGVAVHMDGAQAVGKIPISLKDFPADMMTFSSHKFYGPKGVGGLFIRRGTRLASLMEGGLHERKMRPGTENVAGIVGMATALEIACCDMQSETQRLARLRESLKTQLSEAIEDIEFNGESRAGQSLANTLNISFAGVDAHSLLVSLDLEGMCVSTGAACSSGAIEPSPVLIAMKGSKELAKSSIRISLGRSNDEGQIAKLSMTLRRLVYRVRSAVDAGAPSRKTT